VNRGPHPVTIAGRRAVVTGATRGIGAAIARALDEAGVRTLVVGRDNTRASAVARSLKHAVPLVADLTDKRGAARVATSAPELLGGPVDILVNNAGIFAVAKLEQLSDALVDQMLGVNLAAPFHLLRAFIPAMRARSSGHIITIGSVADRATYEGNAAYAATKFGTRALHQVARAELLASGVRVTLISPGPTDTPLWDAHDPDHTPGFTPRERMLRAADVADAVLWALTRPEGVNIDELRLSHA
jgi:NADP-dependent 3-hydroxy acid dehydrogenase YdfG